MKNNNVIKTDSLGREIAEHGSFEYPVAVYEKDVNKETVGWHWHDELEFIFIEDGSVLVCADKLTMILKKGQSIFVNSGTLHSVWSDNDKENRLRSIVFSPRLISSDRSSIYWKLLVEPVINDDSLRFSVMDGKEDWHKDLFNALENIWENALKRDEESVISVRDSLSRVLNIIRERSEGSGTSKSSKNHLSDRLKIMIQFIEDHFSEDITLKDIASFASISESAALRNFRSYLHISPISYLKDYRIDRAADLIISTEDKINYIASECGFSDFSYFSLSFKKKKGMTPLDYRKSYLIHRQDTQK